MNGEKTADAGGKGHFLRPLGPTVKRYADIVALPSVAVGEADVPFLAPW